MKKPNSHDSETYIKKLIDRLKDGYSHIQLAHAIIGLTVDKWHVQNKLLHVEYAIRSGEKIDKLIDSAESRGINEQKVEQRYDWFCDRLTEGKSIQQIIIEYDKNGNNNNNLNPNTGAKLF